MAEEREMRSGKDLLERCIEMLNEKRSGESGGNLALHPTVVVLLGERCRAYAGYIKNTLDENWNNARFLQYVGIAKKGDSWECARLAGPEAKGGLSWVKSAGDAGRAVSDAIVEMLQKEKGFQDKNRIKLEFVMDATEEEGKAYYDFSRSFRSGLLQYEDLRTFYLMLDQMPGRDRKERSDRILQHLLADRENPDFGTVYLLSNCLDDGDILGDDRIWRNYRLVADIILLGGNRSSDSGYVKGLYNGIKTAGYALVMKPTEKIATVSLMALMREMYEREEEKYGKELSEKEVRERLRLQRSNELPFAEEIFERAIEENLPVPGDLRYLPFRSREALKEIQKPGEISAEDADRYTMGMWSLFQQERYVAEAERFLADGAELRGLRKTVREYLSGAFSLFELRKLEPGRDMIREMLEEELGFEGVDGRRDYTERLHRCAVYACRKRFYDGEGGVKRTMAEEFDRLLEQAERYGGQYADCEREVRQERFVTGDGSESGEEEESIEKIYTEKVRQYVKDCQRPNSRDSAFPKVFEAGLGKEELMRQILEAFRSLIRDKIFQYDFESELGFRLNKMNDKDKYVYVQDMLQKALNGSVRLKTLTNVMTKRNCFYLINDTAPYANQLRKQEGCGRDFRLFDLNRTDCIEQIEIYDVTQPEDLCLNSTMAEQTGG